MTKAQKDARRRTRNAKRRMANANSPGWLAHEAARADLGAQKEKARLLHNERCRRAAVGSWAVRLFDRLGA